MTRIAVYGAGGVGGYFGARLARAGADVHFLARGAHLRALREHGMRVRSVTGDFQVPARRYTPSSSPGPSATKGRRNRLRIRPRCRPAPPL